MAEIAKAPVADQGQRRASFQQARSHETKRSLVQAAMALWRANGYARTTVADICRAAGVSKALFYFYFPRKEDVLFEVGVLSTDAAHSVATEMLAKPYEHSRGHHRGPCEPREHDAHAARPNSSSRRSSRATGRPLAGHDHLERTSVIFAEVFERAQQDGKLPEHASTSHTSRTWRSHSSVRARGIGRQATTETVPSPRSSAATSPRWSRVIAARPTTDVMS